MSINTGSESPYHQIKFRQALCEGVINSVEAVYYAGVAVASANWTLYDGSQTTSPAAPFDKDFSHFGTLLHFLRSTDWTLPAARSEGAQQWGGSATGQDVCCALGACL